MSKYKFYFKYSNLFVLSKKLFNKFSFKNYKPFDYSNYQILDIKDYILKKNRKIFEETLQYEKIIRMNSDILKYEHFLNPGTIILTDGRTANARFLKANFQRKWKYKFDEKNDQSLFYLNEKPLGRFNKKQMNFYKSR